MKKLLFILTAVLSTQITYPQLYSTAERQRYNKKAISTTTTLPYYTITNKTTSKLYHTTTLIQTQPRPLLNAWKGEINKVGIAINSNTPTIKRNNSFGNGNLPAEPTTPTAPITNIPYTHLIIYTTIYIITKKEHLYRKIYHFLKYVCSVHKKDIPLPTKLHQIHYY